MINKSYLAGFVDGEGSISCYKRKDIRTKKGFTINSIFSIAGTNKEILEELNQICKGKIFTDKPNRHFQKAKITHHLQIQDLESIRTLLKLIVDKLVIKQPQAKLMIEYCNLRLKNKGKSYSDREIQIAEEITKMNRRGREDT